MAKRSKKTNKKPKRQSPKEVIIKATDVLEQAVKKYRLSPQFQKKLAKALLRLVAEVEAQALAVGCCTVYVNGGSVSFPSGPYFCQGLGGEFDPEPC